MKKKYHRVIVIISLMLIISLFYNVQMINKIKSDYNEKEITRCSIMKVHLLEFYQDIQTNTAFLDNKDVEMLMYLIL